MFKAINYLSKPALFLMASRGRASSEVYDLWWLHGSILNFYWIQHDDHFVQSPN